VPDGVTDIRVCAFWGANLKSVTFPDGVTNIKAYALANCKSLTSVTFKSEKPPAIAGVENNPFYRCEKMKTVFVPKGAKSAYGKVAALKGFEIKEWS